MQTWYLNEVSVVYFKVGKPFRGNIKGKRAQGEWAATTKEKVRSALVPLQGNIAVNNRSLRVIMMEADRSRQQRLSSEQSGRTTGANHRAPSQLEQQVCSKRQVLLR